MALAWVLSFSEATSIPGGFQKRGDKVIKLDFNKVAGKTSYLPPVENKKKRAGTFEFPLDNKGSYYLADIWVGSNGDKISVDVDTGSSDLWLIDSASGVSATDGSYDHSKSSSYKYVASGFSIGYADGSYAKGDWVSDKVSLIEDGSVSIPALEFGDATDTTITYGILGIGLPNLEAASTEYDNLPVSLKKQGYISKNAYSLYLNSAEATTGSVLFGGIDKAKYSGDLVSLPVTSSNRLNLDVKSFSIGDVTVNTGVSTTLDSGSTISYLNPDLLSQFASKLGLTYQDGDSPFYYWDNCEDAGDLKVSFDGVDITVPKSYVTSPLQYNDGSTSPACALLVLPDDRFNILGDNFLRNAYVVYDLDDMKISLAPVKYSTDEDISPIS